MGFTFNPFTGNFDAIQDAAANEILTGSFSAANNQTTAANVTNLDVSSYKGARVELTVEIDATADLFEKFQLDIMNKSTDFDMVVESLGDTSNITFTITSAGQVQYTSGNEAGFVSSTFTWAIVKVV